MNYYRIQPDIHAEYGIKTYPADVESGLFLRGIPCTPSFTVPLSFEVSNPAGAPPRHFVGSSVPVWSSRFLETVTSVGVRNVDAYQAVLKNPAEKLQWSDYHAINIIGLLACADMNASEYGVIVPSADGVPYVNFHRLVIDPSGIMGVDIFRIAQDPGIIIASQRIITALKATAPGNGWGISAFPVELAS
jgi:hypothetical protein